MTVLVAPKEETRPLISPTTRSFIQQQRAKHLAMLRKDRKELRIGFFLFSLAILVVVLSVSHAAARNAGYISYGSDSHRLLKRDCQEALTTATPSPLEVSTYVMTQTKLSSST